MLSFLKISPRPTWSVLIITQNLKIIFKSNQSHWKATQLSKTFLFTPKANSKQKWVKKHKNARTKVLTAHITRAVHTHVRAKKGRVYTQPMPCTRTTMLVWQHNFFFVFSVFTISRIKFNLDAVFTYALLTLSSIIIYRKFQVSTIPKIIFQNLT